MRCSLRRSSLLAVLIAVPLFAGSQLSHPAQAQAVAITIANFAYQPATLTVSPGTTVTWTNQDDTPHTVTGDDNSFDSGTLNSGQSFSFTFSQAGTFTYHCGFHPFMTGSIVVRSAAGTPSASPTSTAASGTAEPQASLTPTLAAPTSGPAPTPSRTSTAGKRIVRPAIANGRFVFSPMTVTVKVGTKVTWENPSNVPHTVTSLTGRWKLNKFLNARKSVSFVFKQPGTYKYHCALHPGMNGRVVVKRR